MNTLKPQATCTYRVTIKALVINDAKEFLVVKEQGRDWDLPGGGMDWGENPHQALSRELTEELGVTGDIEPNPVIIAPHSNATHDIHLLHLIYRVRLDVSQIKPTSDVAEWSFLSLEDFRQSDANGNGAEWLSAISFWDELEQALA